MSKERDITTPPSARGLDRRRLLGGVAAGALTSLIPSPVLRAQSTAADPEVAFLGLGPDEEQDRIGFVFERLAALGTRYGYRLHRLDPASASASAFRDQQAIVVFGAGLGIRGSDEGAPRIDEKVLKRVRAAVRRGSGLLALHEAAALWPSSGRLEKNQTRRTPWTDLVGGEMIGSMPRRPSVVRMVDRDVPGMRQLGAEFEFSERWLAFKNFDPQMHVVMIQDTAAVEGDLYRRPSYPLTWLRYEGKGRVFYSALGYEREGWDTDVMRRCMVGGMLWILRDTEVDVSANLMRVTPGAIQASYPT